MPRTRRSLTFRRRKHKPRIDTMIKQAEKAGKNVASITTPEGYTITFGPPGADDVKPNGNANPWDEVLRRGTH